ncbi:Uncharacterised protein [Escherichia coli]|uniref:Uncharacterized protein n=1 Tax=Escherichia coli TaxID=562 RepID=A0A2X1NAI3_ECOLX|nr:Uncharacterised protein [Escherichia coli]
MLQTSCSVKVRQSAQWPISDIGPGERLRQTHPAATIALKQRERHNAAPTSGQRRQTAQCFHKLC